VRPLFVDVHSHVCPSGDDGARTVAQGRDLCLDAARRGTRILFATPHVWPHLPLGEERERGIRAAFARLAPQAGLELRLGFELTPTRRLPFRGAADLFYAVAGRAEQQGLQVIVGHPERTEAVLADGTLAAEIAERGWLVQLNASSLTGWEGPEIQALGWRLLEDGVASLVASDGHRPSRPAHLDEAYMRAQERVGPAVVRLFDGSALGLAEAAAA
jgi:protein-tyrosine phosphatase